MKPIYLDYNATTPVDPQVVEIVTKTLQDNFGNPSSTHTYGKQALKIVTRARSQVARLLNCEPTEVIFTSGGSESNNLAIKGVAFNHVSKGRHIITSVTEHPAVLNTFRYLEERFGFEITYIPVDRTGIVNPNEIASAIRSDTTLVSIMMANNETGTLQPIAEISELAHKSGVVVHTDASQAVGKVPTSVKELGVDLLSVAGHKLYAPKGIGALYVRNGTELDPLVHGASHESGRRAGTENVPYIAGLGMACELADQKIPLETQRLKVLRDKLHERLDEAIFGSLPINGHPTLRLPNTLNISFPGILGNDLLAAVPGIAASTGSACHAGVTKPSPVLKAMGLSDDVVFGALRLSLGRWSTESEVEAAARLLISTVKQLRS